MTDEEMLQSIKEGWNPVCLHILGQQLVNRLVALIRLQQREQSFEELARTVQLAESKMTDEQRIQFWDVIQMSYCKYCGQDISKSRIHACQCCNDE